MNTLVLAAFMLAASSGAAPQCDAKGKIVGYAPCETVKQCERVSRLCGKPRNDHRQHGQPHVAVDLAADKDQDRSIAM